MKTIKQMIELKTLKDMEKENYENPVYVPEFIDKLKKEAIKWVKAMQHQTEFCLKCHEAHSCLSTEECDSSYGDGFLTSYDYESSDILGAISILKHFFNLTEKDVEEKEQ